MIETILAVVGGLAGLAGLGISIKAERRAGQAEQRAGAAEQRQLWTEAIMAAHDLVSVNVFAEDMKPQLVRLRAAETELIDGLPEGTYGRISEWLAHEHQRLSYALHYTYVEQEGKPLTTENVFNAHKKANTAAAALVSNLRYFRKMQPGKQLDEEMERLTRQAKTDIAWLKQAVGEELQDD